MALSYSGYANTGAVGGAELEYAGYGGTEPLVTGPQGPPGPAGAAGPTGATGPAGVNVTIGSGHVLGNASGASAPAADTALSGLLDTALGSAQGNILYRSAGAWTVLPPGTSGYFLRTSGAGGDPSWSLPLWQVGTVTALNGLSISSGTLSPNVDGVTVTNTAGTLAAPSWLFGTGADGNVTVSSGTTTITRDMHYANLTLSGTGKINVNGFRVFVAGTLDISAAGNQAIYTAVNPGGAGSGATGGGGAGALASPLVPYHGPNGANGATGTTGVGAAGAAGSGAGTFVLTSPGSAGGAGGAGGSGAGGAGGAVSGSAGTVVSLTSPFWMASFAYACGGAACTGGGSGAGDGTNAGGGGGGGCTANQALFIFANTINRGASTAAGALWCRGSNGGNGGNGTAGNTGGGGGGGGGQSGYIWIVCNALTGATATNCLDITPGNGGAGGNGVGTGIGGTGGTGGRTGGYSIICYGTNRMTLVPATNAAGVAGNAGSGTAGGAGGVAATLQGSL